MMHNQSVLKSVFGLAAGAAVLFFSGAAGTAFSADNQCVTCHGQIPETEAAHPAHSFQEWKKSVHALKGVSCDVCHGGNPNAKDQAESHKGIQRSVDQGSRIYFDKIPDSCGACHSRELEGFKRSSHYKELERSGKGPNCVTCHGSMATRVMTPSDMESVCTLCHRSPTRAYAALMTLQTSQKLMDQLKKKIGEGKASRLDVSMQSAALAQSEASYRDVLQVWHTFDTARVLELSQELNRHLRNSSHELELKQKNKAGTRQENQKPEAR